MVSLVALTKEEMTHKTHKAVRAPTREEGLPRGVNMVHRQKKHLPAQEH